MQSVEQGDRGRPHIVDMIKNNEIVLIINTVEESAAPSRFPFHPHLRPAGPGDHVPTIWGAEAAAEGIRNRANWWCILSRPCTRNCINSPDRRGRQRCAGGLALLEEP